MRIFLFVVNVVGHLEKLLARNEQVSDFTVGVLIFNRHTVSGGVVGDDNSGNGGGGSAASARVSADNEASSAIGNAVRRRGLKRRRLL